VQNLIVARGTGQGNHKVGEWCYVPHRQGCGVGARRTLSEGKDVGPTTPPRPATAGP
jgi:hypothetical protein